MFMQNFNKILRLDSNSCVNKILSLTYGKMQHFGGNMNFFQNIDYGHFCLQPHTVSYDHKRIQKFKREFKNTTYKVLCPFWNEMPHFGYHQEQILFVPDNSRNGAFYPRIGSKPSL